MVSQPLDKGSFGTIHECVDINQPTIISVVKISENYQMLGSEIQALKDIKSREKHS